MTNTLIYKKELLSEDILMDIANIFFSARADKKISLDEVAKITAIPKKEIDAIEICATDLYFNYIAKLLDFYKLKLDCYGECFPGLPQKFYEKYFL